MKAKKIGSEVVTNTYLNTWTVAYEQIPVEITSLYSIYEDEDGNKFKKCEGRVDKIEIEEDSNDWMNESFTG